MNLLKQLQTVTFHRAFVDLGGGINAALMLSNAIYWTNRLSPERDGWFYKTKEDWEAETGLTRHEQDKARGQLVERGLLETRRAKVSDEDCVTALWFRVALNTLAERLNFDQKPENGFCQKPQTGFTKSHKPAFGLLIDKRTSTTTSPPPRVAVFMPDTWLPDDAVYPLLQTDGISLEFAVNCLPEFRLYWARRGDARADWDSVFVRQVRAEFAYRQDHEARRHADRSANRANLPGQPARQSGRPRKETLAERCERYDRFAAGLDARLDGGNAPETAYNAITGVFQRH